MQIQIQMQMDTWKNSMMSLGTFVDQIFPYKNLKFIFLKFLAI